MLAEVGDGTVTKTSVDLVVTRARTTAAVEASCSIMLNDVTDDALGVGIDVLL